MWSVYLKNWYNVGLGQQECCWGEISNFFSRGNATVNWTELFQCVFYLWKMESLTCELICWHSRFVNITIQYPFGYGCED